MRYLFNEILSKFKRIGKCLINVSLNELGLIFYIYQVNKHILIVQNNHFILDNYLAYKQKLAIYNKVARNFPNG